jgi:hypothetical protein
MQSQVEVRPIFVGSKYTAEKEQDALEVLTMAFLLKKYIAAGKDETKQEFFKLLWTEYVPSIKTLKEALKASVVNCSMDWQEPANIESEINDKNSDDVRMNKIIESAETEKSLDAVLQKPQFQTVKVKQVEIREYCSIGTTTATT